MRNSNLKQYLYGLKCAIPVLVGFLPVSISFAIMAAGAGLNVFETVFMSLLVFAGASQIMSVGMIASGAGALPIIIATFVLNLRHIIMSTCVFKKFKVKKIGLKFLYSFGITDETFALFTTAKEENNNGFFLLGLQTVTYSSWVIGTLIGAFATNFLPKIISDSFGIALYALFIALLIPEVKRSLRIFIVVLLTAIINVLLCQFIPSSWSIIFSTLIGAGVGTFIVDDKNDTNALTDQKEESA